MKEIDKNLFDAIERFESNETIGQLIQSGADINCYPLHLGGTPLDFALRDGRSKRIPALLTKLGAKTGKEIRIESIPKLDFELIEAIKSRNIALVTSLLENGANPNGCDENDTIMLSFAIKSGCDEIVGKLLEKGTKGSDNNEYSNELNDAIDGNHPGIIKLLVRAGANVEHALHRIAWYLSGNVSKIELTDLLISLGADVNSLDNSSGKTILEEAASRGDVDFAELLLKKGANIDGGKSDNSTALLSAIRSSQMEVAELLIKSGADINKQEKKSGNAPLHYACERGISFELVKILVLNGAEVNIRNKQGKTPLDWAYNGGKKRVREFLKKHGAKRCDELEPLKEDGDETALIHAIEKNDIQTLSRLIEEGPNLDFPVSGYNPVSRAIVLNHIEILQLLLKNHAHLGTRKFEIPSPYQLAVWKGNRKAIESLLAENSMFLFADCYLESIVYLAHSIGQNEIEDYLWKVLENRSPKLYESYKAQLEYLD